VLAAKDIDSLAHGVRHLAEPTVENIKNRLAGGLDDAFFKAFLATFLATFLDTFFKGEFFEEGDVGHGFVG
jgi:hypothetical protein